MDPNFDRVGEIEDKVIEEMAELTKEICKARRFGYENYHPAEPNRLNYQRIRDEIKDVRRRLDEYGLKLDKIMGDRPDAKSTTA